MVKFFRGKNCDFSSIFTPSFATSCLAICACLWNVQSCPSFGVWTQTKTRQFGLWFNIFLFSWWLKFMGSGLVFNPFPSLVVDVLKIILTQMQLVSNNKSAKQECNYQMHGQTILLAIEAPQSSLFTYDRSSGCKRWS